MRAPVCSPGNWAGEGCGSREPHLHLCSSLPQGFSSVLAGLRATGLLGPLDLGWSRSSTNFTLPSSDQRLFGSPTFQHLCVSLLDFRMLSMLSTATEGRVLHTGSSICAPSQVLGIISSAGHGAKAKPRVPIGVCSPSHHPRSLTSGPPAQVIVCCSVFIQIFLKPTPSSKMQPCLGYWVVNLTVFVSLLLPTGSLQ